MVCGLSQDLFDSHGSKATKKEGSKETRKEEKKEGSKRRQQGMKEGSKDKEDQGSKEARRQGRTRSNHKHTNCGPHPDLVVRTSPNSMCTYFGLEEPMEGTLGMEG